MAMIGPIAIATTALAALFDWEGKTHETLAPDLAAALDIPVKLTGDTTVYKTRETAWDAVTRDFEYHKHRPITIEGIDIGEKFTQALVAHVSKPFQVIPVRIFAEPDQDHDIGGYERILWKTYMSGNDWNKGRYKPAMQIDVPWEVVPVDESALLRAAGLEHESTVEGRHYIIFGGNYYYDLGEPWQEKYR